MVEPLDNERHLPHSLCLDQLSSELTNLKASEGGTEPRVELTLLKIHHLYILLLVGTIQQHS